MYTAKCREFGSVLNSSDETERASSFATDRFLLTFVHRHQIRDPAIKDETSNVYEHLVLNAFERYDDVDERCRRGLAQVRDEETRRGVRDGSALAVR